jgi:hypothetical protein
MRPLLSIAAVAFASTTLAGCTGFNWDKFARLPIVCPSSVFIEPSLLRQGLVRFRPYVQNRGIDDNKDPFTVHMLVKRASGGGAPAPVLGLNYVPNTLTIPGTNGVPGKTAGPEVELTTTTGLGSSTTPYDPNATYSVTLDFKSTNAAIDLASDGCRHLGPLNFRGGQPVP